MSSGLEKKIGDLKTLMNLSSLINSSLDISDIRTRATEAAITLVDAETGSMLLVDREEGDLVFEVALGASGEKLKKIRLARGQGIAGWVAEKGEALIISDVQADPRFFGDADLRSSFRTRSMICVPVASKGRVLGVLQAINKKTGEFEPDDREILLTLANQVAVAIENSYLYHDLKMAFYETAQALAETIEKRDSYTGGHTQRVMNYCLLTGRVMGLSENTLENLKLAAILHDIGKIGVSDDILLKNSRLEAEEIGKMNRHTEFGAEILAHVKQLKDVIPGVRSHHERYDGTGYPDKLKGEDIPLIARIIAVADTFDAMTSNRPYRNSLGMEKALEELARNAGTQFDRGIVEKFIAQLGKGEADAP